MITKEQLNGRINLRADFIEASIKSNTQRGRKVNEIMKQHFGIQFNKIISGK